MERLSVKNLAFGHYQLFSIHLSYREISVAKKPKLLSDLFHDTLKDVYFAEHKILKTLPKMAKATQSKDLKAAFVKHEKETRGQVKRLEQGLQDYRQTGPRQNLRCHHGHHQGGRGDHDRI